MLQPELVFCAEPLCLNKIYFGYKWKSHKKECCLGTLYTFGEYLGEFQEYLSLVSV